MSVESEILRIQHNVANAYAAVAEKGGEVPLQPTSDNLATAVASIQTGVTQEELNEALATKQDKLTGTAGQVVGFGADGAAVAVPGWSNPNLLDNWYFSNPVNQRGQGSYTGKGYTIDRWSVRNSDGSVSLDAGGSVSSVVLGANFGQISQILEHSELFKGKQLTASLLCTNVSSTGAYVLLNDGVKQQGSSLKNGLVSVTMTMSEDSKVIFYGIQNNSQTKTVSLQPIAAKLELGSQQTLAHQDASGSWVLNDPPPNKALELLKCQRYYLGLAKFEFWPVLAISPSYIDFSIPVPVKMRIAPSVQNIISNWFDSSWILSVVVNGGSSVRVRAYKENHGLTGPLAPVEAGDYAGLSADL